MTSPIWISTGSRVFDLFRFACHGLVIMVWVGFLGAIFPLGDSLAVFRIELTVLLAIFGAIAFVLGRSFIPPVAVITVLVSGLSLWPYAGGTPSVPAADIQMQQHNLLYGNRETDSFLDHIRMTLPDVLTLQEFRDQNAALIPEIVESHPNHHVCLYDTGGVGVFARRLGPVIASGCAENTRMAWLRIDTAAGPVTFVSVHLFWPFPRAQFWQVQLYEAEIAALPRPLVIGGDFNMVPWAASVRRVADVAGGRIPRGMAATYHHKGRWPAFRIDHVIVPEDAAVDVTRIGKLGSDHNGLWARIKLAPMTPPTQSMPTPRRHLLSRLNLSAKPAPVQ